MAKGKKKVKGDAAEQLIKAATPFGQAMRDLKVKLVGRVRGMSDAAVRSFVLSDEFKEYKEIFLGSDWQGLTDLNDPEARAALLRTTKAQPTATIAPATPEAPREVKPTAARPKGGALTNAATRHQVYLERLKTAEAREYNKLLGTLEQQVVNTLGKLRTPISELTRARLNALLRELRKAQQAALTQSQDALLRRLRNIAAYESSFEATSVNAHTPKAVHLVAASNAKAWARVIETPMSATGDLLEPFVRNMTGREVEMINKVISRGWAEGWTNDELTRVLRGTKALNYKDGLMNELGRHNSTIVRTAVQHTSNSAREATWAENDDIVSGYRWVATLDGRTTSQCRSLDGREFKIGEGPRPPIHMNCRSTTVPVIKGFEDLSNSLQRASKDGPVSGSLTYYEWLKTQSPQFQDSVLGAQRGKLFRDGGLSAERFSQLQLGANFQPLTLEEMQKLEPKAFDLADLEP